MHPELNTDDLHRLAKKRVEQKMGFLTHLLVFVLVNSGLYLLNLLRGGADWQIFPLWGWGLGLTIHGIVTLLSLQGQDLRERLLQAELRTLRERAGR
ncbi:2TM domain-containing protein [Inhella proteolytica]|uniref:2TM domain-containing protein n=1 Tax=Inhella proteolytica TaxID=2795029 RepID=A0A931J523_9BURK|nr:2TM domain-containing protein [Inhella proteolytica]MBH9577002.1 2TM domain-containing protein [Inhella proteolytica]